MNVAQYAPLARVTLKVLPFREHMIHMGLGVAGEFGEVIDAIKKVYIYGKVVDRTNNVEEIGDMLWYVANLLPELDVLHKVMQRALDLGCVHGNRQRVSANENMNMGEYVLQLNKVIASDCAKLPQLDPHMAPGSGTAVGLIESLCGNIGVCAGLLDVDVDDAMGKNIAKLKARYGDKFSEQAALNRDLGAERKVLEGQ